MMDRFDLEAAVAAWRRRYEVAHTFTADDLEELEAHVRDHTAVLMARGRPAEAAFEEAVRKLGDFEASERAYRDVFWTKLAARGHLLHELRWNVHMLASYLRVALRGLNRQRSYALLNIAGLALGLGVCLTLALYVRHEARYDRYLPNAEQVVRLVRSSGDDGFNVAMPPGLADALRPEIPAFAHVTELMRPSRTLFEVAGEHLYVDGVMRTDGAFLDVFPYRVLDGDPEGALDGPRRLVLTASTARRLFGDASAVGRTVGVDQMGTYVDFTVTAVVEDPPSNTHLPFAALRSEGGTGADFGADGGLRWNYWAGAVYAALAPGIDPAAAEAQVQAFAAASNTEESTRDQVVRVEAVTDVHLRSIAERDIAATSDVRYLYLFGAIGVFILLLACINYMNLATARATLRAREVGVRKAVGARGGQLTVQFLVEALLMSVCAIPLALGLALLALPLVGGLVGAEISFDPVRDAGVLVGLAGAALGAGLVAGSYPALYLARFQPTDVLKGSLPGLRRGHGSLRRGLVVLQFAASLVLIVGTLVVQAQLRYIQTKNLGFDEELVVTANTHGLDESAYPALKAALAARPGVAAVSSGMPLGLGYRYMSITNTWTDGEPFNLAIVTVDRGYFETMGFPVAEGVGFGEDVAAPAAVLNRSAAARMGPDLTQAAVGDLVNAYNGDDEMARVVGIVDDFHNVSLRQSHEEAYMFRLEEKLQGTLLVRLRPGDAGAALADVADVWADFVPDRPFDGTFLDEQIAAQYERETRLGRIFLVFAGLAVLVACLGLFGLAAFTTTRRTKEIGIRKTLGASAFGIVRLLTREFVVLVAVAFVVAAPLAYVAAQRWLEGFAYRIDVGPGLFLLAGGAALLAAILAVAYQALRAAYTNPADALRYE